MSARSVERDEGAFKEEMQGVLRVACSVTMMRHPSRVTEHATRNTYNALTLASLLQIA